MNAIEYRIQKRHPQLGKEWQPHREWHNSGDHAPFTSKPHAMAMCEKLTRDDDTTEYRVIEVRQKVVFS